MRELWFTPADSAILVGLKIRQFRDAIQPLISPAAVKRSGRLIRFAGPAVVAAAIEYRAPKIASDEEAMLAGGDSVWLERYREVKTRLAQKELEEREKTHANLKDLESALNRFANRIHGAGETLQRKFGADASDVLNDAIDDALTGWRRDRQAEAEAAGAGGTSAAASIPTSHPVPSALAIRQTDASDATGRKSKRSGRSAGTGGHAGRGGGKSKKRFAIAAAIRRRRSGDGGNRKKGARPAAALDAAVRRAGDHTPHRPASK